MPEDLIESVDWKIRVSIIPNTRATIANATMINVRLKTFSARIWRKERFMRLVLLTVSGVFNETTRPESLGRVAKLVSTDDFIIK